MYLVWKNRQVIDVLYAASWASALDLAIHKHGPNSWVSKWDGGGKMTIIMTLSNGSVLSRREPATPPAEIVVGSYFTPDGNVARVRKSRQSDRLYAERFNETTMKFEYERGLVYHLGARMTMEQAREWGTRLGHCCNCGKKLTHNKSVDEGIGPKCAKMIRGN
jgi:hypothetical protein